MVAERPLHGHESYRVDRVTTRPLWIAIAGVVVVGLMACGVARSPAPPPAPDAASSAPSVGALATSAFAPLLDPTRRPRFAKELDVATFKKGNVHTHSNVSDGDSSPETVVRWYRDHGYDFLALTEHNILIDTKKLAALQTDRFKLVSGEEITMTGAGAPVHVNGLCLGSVVAGGTYATPREALDHAIAEVNAQGGVALVNHPNFEWALDADDVIRSEGAQLLEVASGHPHVHTLGDCDEPERSKERCRPSHEALWDAALQAGRDFAPVAVDDAHRFQAPQGYPEARAGRAWIQVFSSEGTPEKLCERMRAGELYASTGAEISRYRVRADRVTVWPASADAIVEFIGRGGRVLEAGRLIDPAEPSSSSYVIDGTEGYVRARVREPSGARAWLPAARVAAPTSDAPKSEDLRHDARREAP